MGSGTRVSHPREDSRSALGEERLQIESFGKHGERAIGVAGPLLTRAVPIELEPVPIRIPQVNRLAHPVIRRAIDPNPVRQQPAQGAREIRASWVKDCSMIKARRP